MTKVRFNEVEERKVNVELNGKDYGYLEFDKNQDAWVLWPNDIDDGVTYYDDLQETEEEIREELEDADED